MSKIGKQNIIIPDKVKIALNGSNLEIEGPMGKKSLNIEYITTPSTVVAPRPAFL